MKKTHIFALLAVTAASTLMAAERDGTRETSAAVTAVSSEQIQEFKWGGDIRLRSVYFDNIPYANTPIEARSGANSFQRYRTRLFGEYHPNESLYFRGRVVNEFRTYQTPDNQSWSALDETVFDNLFVDYNNDLFNVRIGRQDLIYGTGKLILDGTPKDGSRTIYFDAAKVSYKGIKDTTVDFLALYTHALDPLAIHSQEHDINGLTAATYEGVEAGGGIYIKNNSHENLPWEAYYLTKTEQMFLPDGDEINTVGTRLMPKCTDGPFDGSLEVAYQSSPEVDAFMIDALANWHIESMQDQKATLGLGWYHLSEDWNPLFARWPQYSELYVYSFDTTGAGAWQNVSLPHIDFSISPCKSLKSDLLLGYMFAEQNNGLGGGYNRGLLFTWWNQFTIREKIFSETDKLAGHLLLEVFDPGDYYNGDQRDKTATFVRAEASYSF